MSNQWNSGYKAIDLGGGRYAILKDRNGSMYGHAGWKSNEKPVTVEQAKTMPEEYGEAIRGAKPVEEILKKGSLKTVEDPWDRSGKSGRKANSIRVAYSEGIGDDERVCYEKIARTTDELNEGIKEAFSKRDEARKKHRYAFEYNVEISPFSAMSSNHGHAGRKGGKRWPR